MVRETRHLWVGNLPESIREDRVRDYFERYGRVQSVKVVASGAGTCAAVAFMDITSAAKANSDSDNLTFDEHPLIIEYYEPSAYPPGTLPAPPTPAPRYSVSVGSEEHPAFDRSDRTSHYYERASTPGSPHSAARTDADFIRRSYHSSADNLRGRTRERVYRNGPSTFPPNSERTNSNSSNQRRTWQVDSTCPRYPADPPDTPVVAAAVKRKPSASESRSGSQSSRSRSPAPSPTQSPVATSSRSSPSSERSTSPAEIKTKSTTVITSGAPASAAATLNVYSDDRRPLAVCVRDLPVRSSDTSLKDGLFHEYKKHGKVTWVKVVGSGNDRYALVCFKKPEDVEKAIEVSQDKSFFGCKINVAPYHGYDVEDNEARPYDTELDEFHPKATRTLFIGNLEKDVTPQDLRQRFEKFGEIIEIDVKKQSVGTAQSYAFCQYTDITSVVQAMRSLDGEPMGSPKGETRLKLGFGKSMASIAVWVAGLAEQVSEKHLELQFRKFGAISNVVIDRSKGQALIFFDQVPHAAAAVKEMRGVPLRGRRIQLDFASRECQEAFFVRVENQREPWTGEEPRARYDPARVRSGSYSRGSGGRTPRRHDVVSDSPRYRSFEDLSPNSDFEEVPPGEQTDLTHLHKRRDVLQKLLILDNREKKPLRQVTAADQGLVVTTQNHHRRRLSSHRRSSGEGSAAPLLKRRKTGSTSEDERRRLHHYSGDESRPGTPLIDELPDQPLKEPRRLPGKRSTEPMILPLPDFAVECFPELANAWNSTPTSAPQSPPRCASPARAPPKPRTPSPAPSLNSSDSEISPQSPAIGERIKSLDEMMGRTEPVISKPRHPLLKIDVKDLQPSEISKSLLSRPSVFDEDSKRLENVNDKYEPRDFYQRPAGLEFLPSPRLTVDPRSVPLMPISPHGSHGSPSPAGLSPAVKGQYPFPSHPPAGATGACSPHVIPIKTISATTSQKVEDWLTVNHCTDPNATTNFSQRYLISQTARQKVSDLSVSHPRTDGKPSDPRLDKGSAPLPPASPVTPVAASPSMQMGSQTPQRVNRFEDWPRFERPAAAATPASGRLDLSVETPKPVMKLCHPVKPVEPQVSVLKPVSEPEPVHSACDKNLNVPVRECKPDSDSAQKKPQTITMNKSTDYTRDYFDGGRNALQILSDFAAVSRMVDAPLEIVENAVHQSESTKTLDVNVVKPNVSQCKNVTNVVELPTVQSPVIPPAEAVAEDKSSVPAHPRDPAVKPDNGLIVQPQPRQTIPPKPVSDPVPFNVRDKESGVWGLDRTRPSAKEKEKPREEREKHKEKPVCERERDKEKDRQKNQSKSKEISETIDKEKKKDRDVEIDRKKDRESMEIIEREKRKGSSEELEVDHKKEQIDPLDRRKSSTHSHERKLSDPDKNKKRDSDKDKRKDDRDKKKEHLSHSSDRHRKSSDEKRRDEDEKSREKSKTVHNSSTGEPAVIGQKRRISSADSAESNESKRAKVDLKRRDSRDSRSSGGSKRIEPKESKPNHAKSSESPEYKPSETKRRDEEKRKVSDHSDKSRSSKKKSKPERDEINHKEFNGKSSSDTHDRQKYQASDSEDERRHNNNKTEKDKKRPFGSSESLEEKNAHKKVHQIERRGEEKIKENGLNESLTDSDSEPKKHSIFDVVVDDQPAYISMYDKVKARSTKNLQKQAEEKKQVKIKEKFSALKQSRAKREEKKRSTSWDEDSDSDEIHGRPMRRYSCLSSGDDDDEPRKESSLEHSEENAADRSRSGKLRTSDIYSDDEDSDSAEHKSKLSAKNKLSEEFKSSYSKPFNGSKMEKSERPNHKARLSLDCSNEKSNEVRHRKKSSHEGLSENEHKYGLSKSDRKKKKKEKRHKWSDDEKFCEGDRINSRPMSDVSDDTKFEKSVRRKSIQIGESYDENRPKKRTPTLSATVEAFTSRDDNKFEDIFGSCDDSNQSHAKTDESIPSKWNVDDIYNDSDDSNNLSGFKKIRDKKKKEKKREPCKEVMQAQEVRSSYEKVEELLGFDENADLKLKAVKEKKKKRRKSKDRSNRHHHHHSHHDVKDRRESHENHEKASVVVEQEVKPMPSLESTLPSLSRSPSPSPPMPLLTKTASKEETKFPTEKESNESAIMSITMPETPKSSKIKSAVPESVKEKERIAVSQEEIDVAVASLSFETFGGGNSYPESLPAEPEASAASHHDEEEMRKAVLNLNSDQDPATPQSDSDLLIDTDPDESDEFAPGRFDFIPRTPDIDMGPPKTPDISPAVITQVKQLIRKDTMRNSRDDMEVPIVDSSPEAERKPPVLTPPSPKLNFPEGPPAIEPQAKPLGDKVFVNDTRLPLAPPPLVPVSKQVSPTPRPTIVRPLPPTAVVVTPIRSNIAGPVHSTPLTRKIVLSPSAGPVPVRLAIPPPVLSPVTPVATVAPKQLSSSGVMRYNGPSTIVAARQIPVPVAASKIVVPHPQSRPSVSVAEPSRLQAMPPLAAASEPERIQRAKAVLTPQATSLPMPHIHTTQVITHTPERATPVLVQSLPSPKPITPVVTVQPAITRQAPVVPVAQPVITTTPVTTIQMAQKSPVPPTPKPVIPQVSSVPPAKAEVVSVIQKQVEAIEVKAEKSKPLSPVPERKLFESLVGIKQDIKDEAFEVKQEVKFFDPKKEDDKIDIEEHPVKVELAVESKVTESVIKRVEPEVKVNVEVKADESEVKEKSPETSGFKDDESSDDDKPINALAKKNRKKAAKGSSSSRRSHRAGGKGEALPTVTATVANTPAGKETVKAKTSKCDTESEKRDKDVYDFDESDEEVEDQDRPRLLMTIKSPNSAKEPVAVVSKLSPGGATKEVAPKTPKTSPVAPAIKVKEPTPEPQKPSPTSNSNNTRKSRRLIEKERSTIDEVIEHVVRNVNTRASPRRSTRQTTPVKTPAPPATPPAAAVPATPQLKKARGKKQSSVEDSKNPSPKSEETDDFHPENEPKEMQLLNKPVEESNEMSDEEPTTLIDPVTGMLTAMKAKEGGKYVPVPGVVTPPTPPPMVPPTPPATAPLIEPAEIKKSLPPPPVVPAPSIVEKPAPVPETAVEVAPPIEKTSTYVTGGRPPTPPSTPLEQRLPATPIGQQPTVLAPVSAQSYLSQVQQKIPDTITCRPVEAACNKLTITKCDPPPRSETTITRVDLSVPAYAESYALPKQQEVAAVVKPVVLPPKQVYVTSCNVDPMSRMPVYTQPPMAHVGPPPLRPQVAPPVQIQTILPPTHSPGNEMRHTKSPRVVGPMVGVPQSAYDSRLIHVNRSNPSTPPLHDVRQMMMKVQPNGRPGMPTPPLHILQPHGPIQSPPSELLPMTGAVASPPPRHPHFISQQPIVAGASSSRAMNDAAKAQRASPRPHAIPPFDRQMLKSGSAALSPPPAHQQGDAVGMSHLGPYMHHHHQMMYQQYLPMPTPYRLVSGLDERVAGELAHNPQLELRRPEMYMPRFYEQPPPAHLQQRQLKPSPQLAEAPSQPRIQVATPPHASQVPAPHPAPFALMKYPMVWQGMLALKTEQSTVQMHYITGSRALARTVLSASTPTLRIAQRMRLEQSQLETVHRKIQVESDHCMLIAVSCGKDAMDHENQKVHLNSAFINYLKCKGAAGIVNIADPSIPPTPGVTTSAAYVAHIFPTCDFTDDFLRRVAPDVLEALRTLAHLIVIIATAAS